MPLLLAVRSWAPPAPRRLADRLAMRAPVSTRSMPASSQAYRNRDPRAYGALYTDSAVFEWPAFNTVRGRAGMEAMVRSNWPSLNDMDLRLTVSSRRLSSDHATEFGAFEQSWRDTGGVRMTEFGRYVTVLARDGDRGWLIDRFFGFADSTRPLAARP